jgi:hypothetical protein
MRGTDAEGGGKHEIGKPVIGHHVANQGLYAFRVTYLFFQVDVEDCPSRIFRLQLILEF